MTRIGGDSDGAADERSPGAHGTDRTVAVVAEVTVVTNASAVEVQSRLRSAAERSLRGLGRTTIDIVTLGESIELNASALEEMRIAAEILMEDGWTGVETAVLRRARSMSVRDFADHLGLSDRMISKWEQQGASVRPRPVNQDALNISMGRMNATGLLRFISEITDLRGGSPRKGAYAEMIRRAAAVTERIVVTDALSEAVRDEIRLSMARLARIASMLDGDPADLSRRLLALFPTAEVGVGWLTKSIMRERAGTTRPTQSITESTAPRQRTFGGYQNRTQGELTRARVSEAVASDAMREAISNWDVAAVYRILQDAGVSQRRIAELVGQSQSEISEILSGRKVQAIDLLLRIVDGLGADRGLLIGRRAQT